MSDFVSGFWNIYVAGLTAVSILACAWLLYANTVKRTSGPVELHCHVWDENLQEYNNPLPRWWMWLFYITLVFSLVYLAVYPGFGSFQGGFGWSSVGQYDKEMQKADAQYAPIFNKYLKMDLKAVAANPDAKQMGERMFLTYCSVCHGSEARGAKGFPNLTDKDWLFGGEPEQIQASILDGRNGIMPPFGSALGADGVKDVSSYVRSLSGLAADSARVPHGKELFQQNCAACHGPDGRGNIAMGAPNLADKTWLYGSSEAEISKGVTAGRNNQMPAHKEFLGEAKVHLLAAYVYGLGGGQNAPSPASASTPNSDAGKSGAAGTSGTAETSGTAGTAADAAPVAKVYFDTGESSLTAEGQAALQSIIDFAKANASAKVAISGFHDMTGSQSANEELAKNRAMAVRDALKAAGVSEDRIEMRKPQATTGSGDNREARRVEVLTLL